jgi:hypothetical protein
MSDQDHECSISSAQSEPLRSLPHRDIELMAQIQVLDLKPTPRLDTIPILTPSADIDAIYFSAFGCRLPLRQRAS